MNDRRWRRATPTPSPPLVTPSSPRPQGQLRATSQTAALAHRASGSHVNPGNGPAAVGVGPGGEGVGLAGHGGQGGGDGLEVGFDVGGGGGSGGVGVAGVGAGDAVPEVALTGNERCSRRVEFVVGVVIGGGYSSGLVDAVSGEFGGVVVPVAASLVDPADGGGGCDVEQVCDHGCGQGCGELGEGGASTGLGVDPEQA